MSAEIYLSELAENEIKAFDICAGELDGIQPVTTNSSLKNAQEFAEITVSLISALISYQSLIRRHAKSIYEYTNGIRVADNSGGGTTA